MNELALYWCQVRESVRRGGQMFTPRYGHQAEFAPTFTVVDQALQKKKTPFRGQYVPSSLAKKVKIIEDPPKDKKMVANILGPSDGSVQPLPDTNEEYRGEEFEDVGELSEEDEEDENVNLNIQLTKMSAKDDILQTAKDNGFNMDNVEFPKVGDGFKVTKSMATDFRLAFKMIKDFSEEDKNTIINAIFIEDGKWRRIKEIREAMTFLISEIHRRDKNKKSLE